MVLGLTCPGLFEVNACTFPHTPPNTYLLILLKDLAAKNMPNDTTVLGIPVWNYAWPYSNSKSFNTLFPIGKPVLEESNAQKQKQ